MPAAMTVTAAAVITVPPRSAMKEGAAKIRSGQPLNTSPMIRLPKMANGSGNVTVYANMVYDSQWDAITEYADIPFGIYSFEASENPVPEAIDTSSEMEGIGGALLDGKYYFITATYNQSGNIEGGVMYVYNASNWTLENRKIFCSDNPGALAFQMVTDHAKGVIYTVSYNDNMNCFETSCQVNSKFFSLVNLLV